MRRVARLLLVFLTAAAGMGVSLSAQARPDRSDEWLRRPVDDKTFRTYLSFFTYEATLPFETQMLESDELEGIRREHLSFQTTPGLRAFGRIYHAAAPAGGALGWVIFLHGGTQSAKDGPGNRYVATFLARAGWNVLAIDMLYFGERGTGLLTTYTDPEKHARLYNQPSTYLGWVSQTVKDVGRAFDWLVEERKADPRRIARSRGRPAFPVAGRTEPSPMPPSGRRRFGPRSGTSPGVRAAGESRSPCPPRSAPRSSDRTGIEFPAPDRRSDFGRTGLHR